jgi:hypothetical protein
LVEKSDSEFLIGKFILKSNEESNFTEREFKSIDIDRESKYFRIVCDQCHNNKLNVFNQISIINISCFGNIMGYEDEYISGLRNINPSEAILMTRMFKKGNVLSLDGIYIRINLNLDVFGQKINTLVKAKENAVDREDYMEADKLKQTINKIK